VTELSTVCADLTLVVSKRSVEGGKLSELVSLVVVLAFGSRGSLERSGNEQRDRISLDERTEAKGEKSARRRATYDSDNRVDEINASLDLDGVVSGDQTMQILIRVIGRILRPPLPLLHTPLPSDADLRSTLLLHLLQTVSSRPNEETEEVNLGELLDGDVDLVLRTRVSLGGVVVGRGLEGRVELEGLVDELETLVFELLAVTDFSGVGSATVGVVGRRRGGRPGEVRFR
jgi:hypothetical protein